MKTDTVVTLRQPGEFSDPLTEVPRSGARARTPRRGARASVRGKIIRVINDLPPIIAHMRACGEHQRGVADLPRSFGSSSRVSVRNRLAAAFAAIEAPMLMVNSGFVPHPGHPVIEARACICR